MWKETEIRKNPTVREPDHLENSEDNDRDAHNQAILQVFFRAFIGYKRDFFGYEKKIITKIF